MKKVSLILSAVLVTTMIVVSCEGGASGEGVASSDVTIGEQVWMTKNLDIDKFRNGDPIPHAKSNEEWKNAGINKKPAWCYYNNNPDNKDRNGKLYNWYAVNDPRGLVPKGWKIPSDEDWIRLIDFLGGNNVAGLKMKYTDFWAENQGKSGNGSNESGFSGIPGGIRYSNGTFTMLDYFGEWWSSTENNSDSSNAQILSLHYYSDCVFRGKYVKEKGLAVRCLRE